MSSSFWPLRRTGRRPGDGRQGYAEFLGGAGEALRAGGGLEEAQAFERGRSSTQRTSGRDTVTLRHRTLWRWRQADCCGEAPEREVVPAPRGSAGRKARPAKHTYCNAIIVHAYGDPCVVQLPIDEPPFGWIKSVLGFRQFSLRGLDKVTGEWNLVTLAVNLRRMNGKIEWA